MNGLLVKLQSHTSVIHSSLTLIAFIVLDFAGYVVHAINHRVNFFWNSHLIHHSSEDFNLACALRQSVSVFVRLFIVLLLPAALLGVPAQVIAVVAPLHLFAQFWYHTQHIGKMGFLEKIIVTPSHHRVHHAINKEYLDKNFGQIFIIWDKFFGTFQEELEEVPAAYGITRPVQTWNPVKINFQHLHLLLRDAWYTQSVKDKLRIWYKPTGWRPADVAEKFPVNKIEDVYQFEKYHTRSTGLFLGWTWIQLIFLLFFVSYLFGNIGMIGKPGIFLYGLFIFLYVYAMTELMDNNRFAFVWEILKCSFGISMIAWSGDWFGSAVYAHKIKFLVIAYFVLSLAVSIYFTLNNSEKLKEANCMLTSQDIRDELF